LGQEYWLENLLLRMTAVERNDRIATAAEALELLQESLAVTRPAPVRVTHAPPPLPAPPELRPNGLSKRRTAQAASVLAVVALAFGGWWALQDSGVSGFLANYLGRKVPGNSPAQVQPGNREPAPHSSVPDAAPVAGVTAVPGVQDDPNGPDLAKAKELLKRGQYQAAIELFRQALARDPNSAPARNGLKQATEAKATEELVFGKARNGVQKE
jgi:tetratricopeptide (TPR) repeat protein